MVVGSGLKKCAHVVVGVLGVVERGEGLACLIVPDAYGVVFADGVEQVVAHVDADFVVVAAEQVGWVEHVGLVGGCGFHRDQFVDHVLHGGLHHGVLLGSVGLVFFPCRC